MAKRLTPKTVAHPNPFPASGEREPTELVATTAPYSPANG
jgi:hypothetical protein